MLNFFSGIPVTRVMRRRPVITRVMRSRPVVTVGVVEEEVLQLSNITQTYLGTHISFSSVALATSTTFCLARLSLDNRCPGSRLLLVQFLLLLAELSLNLFVLLKTHVHCGLPISTSPALFIGPPRASEKGQVHH
jgi:hypothetical protein